MMAIRPAYKQHSPLPTPPNYTRLSFFLTYISSTRRPQLAIDFTVKDVIHKIAVKFIHAFLPEAKKPYNLRAVHQPELDVHGIASKADLELIHYLAADGFKFSRNCGKCGLILC
jgi:hypothetical protein